MNSFRRSALNVNGAFVIENLNRMGTRERIQDGCCWGPGFKKLMGK